jgi:hypothetical protein
MYLMAVYGSGNWVEGYYEEQIYLNKKLIENQKVDWYDILKKASDFITQFSGVQDVATAAQWYVDDTGRSAEFRRGMNKKMSGDLFIELQPGWTVVHEDQPDKDKYTRDNAILSPLYVFGSYVQKGHIYRTIKATEIAPSIAFIMRIRPPNASKNAPLQEFIK